MANDLPAAKAALRARMRNLRAALPPAQRRSRAAAAQGHLLALPAWQRARCLLLFWSLADEMATGGLVLAALTAGSTLALPRIVPATGAGTVPGARGGRRRLELRQVPGGAATGLPEVAARLVPGTWGILEPPADAILVAPAAVDLALVPGLAFDPAGRRLGYGGGFYDRLLPQLRPDALVLGYAFACQVVPEVPVGINDVTVAGIVTEDGVTYSTK